ncbi:MAG: hypothetical protein L3J43_05695 [Sulfurovum sp.]|nr:hypothetical protein [Sulfurovum sp.]
MKIKRLVIMWIKSVWSSVLFVLCATHIHASPLSDELVVLHTVTTAEMNAITTPVIGSLIFNTDDNEVYERNTTAWHSISSDGSETKIVAGNCMEVSGTGTTSNPYIVKDKNLGETQTTAGLTCKQILDNGCNPRDGVYWINPDGGGVRTMPLKYTAICLVVAGQKYLMQMIWSISIILIMQVMHGDGYKQTFHSH